MHTITCVLSSRLELTYTITSITIYTPITKSGSIPSCIFSLPKLTFLEATGGDFVGTLPSTITAPLTHLALSHNRLIGTVPSSIWTLKDLAWLDLAKNKLSGTCEALASNPSIKGNSTTLYLDVNR